MAIESADRVRRSSASRCRPNGARRPRGRDCSRPARAGCLFLVLRAWRIVKARHAATAFDGEGARLLGGRWNSPGTRMIYTSATGALAALEMLGHLNRAITLHADALISCDF